MDKKYAPPSLEAALSTTLAKRVKNQTIRKLTTFPSTSADFSSNDFLSLATCRNLRNAYLQELSQDPTLTTHLGSGGSRLLDGNSTYAENLEKQISSFHSAPCGLLCNSGYDANTGLFSCLPQKGDYIVYDEYIHASVHDGMRLSRAKETRFFPHNDLRALRNVLEQILEEDENVQTRKSNVFLAVEAVYSMDGDMVPFREVVELRNELFPQKKSGSSSTNCHIIIDEAHSTGWVGPRGRGLVSDLGLENECLIRLHTFGKALAANGAILLCSSQVLREYLINYARPMIYTTFMSYPNLAAIKASYEVLMSGRGDTLAGNLRRLMRELYERLREVENGLDLGIEKRHLLRCPMKMPETPIFAVLSSEPKALAAYCQREGFVVRGIVPPTVPLGTERIRVCLHAGNTVGEIDGLVKCIRAWTVQRMREIEKAGRGRL
ncbi:hypothetical protein BST61_g2434 [Cercospora zeina]